jgi:hypothetical protein
MAMMDEHEHDAPAAARSFPRNFMGVPAVIV